VVRLVGYDRLCMTDEQSHQIPLAMVEQQRPRERSDAAANRIRILEAARRLLADGGVDALTMDGVASAAGVGKGTVFRRFGNRAGLAAALADDEMRDFQNRFLHGPPPLGPGAPAPQRLEAFVVELLHHYAENLPVAVLAAHELDQYGSQVMNALLFHARTLVRQIDPQLDNHVVATMILSAIAPPLIIDSRQRGIETQTLQASALAVLRGITRQALADNPHAEPDAPATGDR
jgi:AcrR family transcriptional regulator